MKRVVAMMAMAVAVSACQGGGPVYYQAGPRPMNGMEIYAQALRQDDGQSRAYEAERQARLRHQQQMDALRRQEMLLEEQQRQACLASGRTIC